MDVIYPRCAGLDVHKHTVVACVRIARDGPPLQEVRTFDTTTSGLLALADWLDSFGVEHVAMEATGVYWKPVWHVLEGHFELVLANAAHVKNVPGRKTDVNDAMWLADLLAHGLIRASFVPPTAVQELRTLTRTRKQFVRERASHVAAHREGAGGRQPEAQRRHQRHPGQRRPRRASSAHRRPQRPRGPGLAHHHPRQGQPRAAARSAARPCQRASPLHAQGASEPHRRAGQGHCRHRNGGRCRPGALSTSRQAAEHHAGLERGQRQRRRGRDRHRHVALCHARPSPVLGLHVPAQRRERRQAPQHPTASRRQVAQDHPGPSRLVRRQGQRQLPAAQFHRLRHAAAPRRPSSPWPPPCSPPPGTCCATAPNGTTSAPPTSIAPTPKRPPTASSAGFSRSAMTCRSRLPER